MHYSTLVTVDIEPCIEDEKRKSGTSHYVRYIPV